MDDATNSAVWQRRKLQTLKLHCLYLDSEHDEHLIERMVDILPVEGSSALDTLAITKKAFDSVGTPFVDDIDSLPRLVLGVLPVHISLNTSSDFRSGSSP